MLIYLRIFSTHLYTPRWYLMSLHMAHSNGVGCVICTLSHCYIYWSSTEFHTLTGSQCWRRCPTWADLNSNEVGTFVKIMSVHWRSSLLLRPPPFLYAPYLLTLSNKFLYLPTYFFYLLSHLVTGNCRSRPDLRL